MIAWLEEVLQRGRMTYQSLSGRGMSLFLELAASVSPLDILY